MKAVQSAVARAFAPGGRVITVNASTGNLGVSPFKGALRHQMHKAVALARLAEPVEDLRQALLLESRIEPSTPAPGDEHFAVVTRLLETAAVLADRAARGLMRMPAQGLIAMAQCPDWTTGALVPLEQAWAEPCMQALLSRPDLGEVLIVVAGATPDLDDCGARIRLKHPQAVVRAADSLLHFSGSLSGLRRPRAAEVLFPVLDEPGRGALHAVRVVVSPLAGGASDDASIAVVGGTDPNMAQRARRAVQCIRGLESPSPKRWQTVIHLPPTTTDGGSFELAVVVADRIARGRELPGPGQVIATGAIDWAGGSGSVLHVENALNSAPGMAGKTELIAKHAMPNDTVLLPASWQGGGVKGSPSMDALAPFLPQVVFVRHVVAMSPPAMKVQTTAVVR